MKRNQIFFLLYTLPSIFFLIPGCAVSTYDKLPDNVPRGYVEFYGEGVTEIDEGTWGVYKYEDGKEIDVTGILWDGNTRRRIAERPGIHTFIVKFGTANQEVTVDVVEGMIVPVNVHIDLESTKYRYKEKIYNFNMTVSVENAIPY